MRGTHLGVWLAILMLALVFTPHETHAQDTVYSAEQLSQPPRLASATKTADMLRNAARGAAGTVRLQFIVGADGQVEPGSVKVVHSTNSALTAAAEKVARRLEFKPGEKDGKAVRTQVMLPLTFQL